MKSAMACRKRFAGGADYCAGLSKPAASGAPLIAGVHACLGEKDAAFEWLEKAFQEHVSFLVEIKTSPLFRDLHGDPRFDALVKRIGIPD